MKTILITGASAGIGRALAVQAARAGYAVYAVGRNVRALAALAGQIGEEGGSIVTDVCDISDPANAPGLIGRAVGAFGHVDVLVNNAGSAAVGPISMQSDEQMRAQFGTHVIGPLALTREALPTLRASRGHVFMLGSGVARVPVPGMGAYPPSKAALRSATSILRREVAALDVAVTYVDPGAVDTGFMTRAGMPGAPREALISPELVARKILLAIATRPRSLNVAPLQTAAVAIGEVFPALAEAVLQHNPNMIGAGPSIAAIDVQRDNNGRGEKIALPSVRAIPIGGKPAAEPIAEPVAETIAEPIAPPKPEPVPAPAPLFAAELVAIPELPPLEAAIAAAPPVPPPAVEAHVEPPAPEAPIPRAPRRSIEPEGDPSAFEALLVTVEGAPYEQPPARWQYEPPEEPVDEAAADTGVTEATPVAADASPFAPPVSPETPPVATQPASVPPPASTTQPAGFTPSSAASQAEQAAPHHDDDDAFGSHERTAHHDTEPLTTDSPFDAALEPLLRRMERAKLTTDFVRSLMVLDSVIDVGDAAMRWAGMPNKHERALTSEVFFALAEWGFLAPRADGRYRVLYEADGDPAV